MNIIDAAERDAKRADNSFTTDAIRCLEVIAANIPEELVLVMLAEAGASNAYISAYRGIRKKALERRDQRPNN